MSTATVEPVLKVADVAQHLNCDRNTVYRLIEAGDLRAIRVGQKLLRVPESALAEFIAGNAR
ncbi:helix-turn-helix domain-containing protein [Enemella sp. A6]|uniref:helix-turn-helix domain-containing protein n=1 Tax=Enemella sp. A6 TaxID=3440152 RepID=UPI003EBB3A48